MLQNILTYSPPVAINFRQRCTIQWSITRNMSGQTDRSRHDLNILHPLLPSIFLDVQQASAYITGSRLYAWRKFSGIPPLHIHFHDKCNFDRMLVSQEKRLLNTSGKYQL